MSQKKDSKCFCVTNVCWTSSAKHPSLIILLHNSKPTANIKWTISMYSLYYRLSKGTNRPESSLKPILHQNLWLNWGYVKGEMIKWRDIVAWEIWSLASTGTDGGDLGDGKISRPAILFFIWGYWIFSLPANCIFKSTTSNQQTLP